MLKNKVAIVTGGSRGIGKAIVEEFARQGAKVAFNYVKSEESALELKKKVETEGGEILAYKQDVKDYDAIKVMVEGVKSHFGRLDIIVNNAGILRDKALMLMEEQDWEEVITTNLSGAFNLVRAAIVTFMKQKSGNIINITSVAGIKGMPRQVNYSASKAGIIGLTKALAREVGPYNVRVNAIAPGYIDTDMVKDIKEDYKTELLKRIPLNRFGRSDEVAKVATFLASDEAKYITGQVLTIDGGLAM
ncbi:MAG: 3-oxoacyl-[acyl-carrier-protein] reductase [Omnitrophica bacterium RBG_13_46_9]|nr:MAG: 3-oxoacyl-[acyl-carrier-protein] reductase [Omnitrophica bacterium RBG_13_46_9]